MPLIRGMILAVLVFSAAQSQSIVVHIPTSDALKIAQMIARDEGYDIRNEKMYYFDLLNSSDGKPLLKGYASMGFYINGSIRSSISINEKTGQAIDMNSCEVFDYPDLTPFQRQVTSLSNARTESPRALADDAGCSSPKILNKPIPNDKAT